MATNATIYKATVELADMDRQIYTDHSVVLARHPSETDERMMIRLLALALNLSPEGSLEPLEFAKDMWDPDEPALWQKDLTGKILHWIEVGQPEERRLSRVTARAGRVSVYSFGSAVWWSGIANKLTRLRNLAVWQIPVEQSQALAELAQRTMVLQVTIQDGAVYVGNGQRSIEVTPVRLL
jgi:uncharacterized protein YaeQ